MPRLQDLTIPVAAQRVVVKVIAIIPPPRGQVDPAAKGQRIVNRNQFLMMAGADGAVPVKGQMDLVGRHELDLKQNSLWCNHCLAALFQQVDIQPGTAGGVASPR